MIEKNIIDIVLDTETTGLSYEKGHRIIEIAAQKLVDRQVEGKPFQFYINPERDIDPGAQKVHGISLEFLQDKPKFIDIIDDFIDYIRGGNLVIHNAPFDVGFLDYEFHLAGKKFGQIKDYCSVYDTLSVARKMHPGQRNSLDALCKRYAIDNSQRNLHGALIDVDLLTQVYLRMTGGQVSLFQDFSNTGVQDTNSASVNVEPLAHAMKLPVIKATVEELACHEQYLKDIVKL